MSINHQTAAAGVDFTSIEARDGSLIALSLTTPAEMAAFAMSHFWRRPGFYIGTCVNGAYYVGSGKDVVDRTRRMTTGPAYPARLVVITGQSAQISPADAAALERIAYQTIVGAGKRCLNDHPPYGSRVSLERYAALQSAWSSLTSALANVLPDIALPWLGPLYDRLPPPAPNDAFGGSRRYAKRKMLWATLSPVAGGYVIDPGALILAQTKSEERVLSHMYRIESQFARIVVPQGDAMRLQRGVHFSTLAACSLFVFDYKGGIVWEPLGEDHDDTFLDWANGSEVRREMQGRHNGLPDDRSYLAG